MLPKLITLTIIAGMITACNPSPGTKTQTKASSVIPSSSAYEEYKKELCDWAVHNRASSSDYLKFIERSAFLVEGLFGEFAFQALNDRSMARCWWRISESIGLAGSKEQVTRLLNHFDEFRPGLWVAQDDSADIASQASARKGLALGAFRYPEDNISNDIIKHLALCINLEFWTPERNPPLSSDLLSRYSPEEAQGIWGGSQLIRCIDALGSTGQSRAIDILNAYAQTEFAITWGLKDRIDDAIMRNAELKRLGITDYVHKYAAEL